MDMTSNQITAQEEAGHPKAQIIHGRQPRRELTKGGLPILL